MRLIRRLLILAIVGVAGVAAYVYWSDNGPALREKAADVAAETARREAGKIASVAAEKAGDAAGRIKETMGDTALTAKIKSKMALDDHVKALNLNVDTMGSVVTVSGVVNTQEEKDRALQLARDTAGVTQVVDRIQLRR